MTKKEKEKVYLYRIAEIIDELEWQRKIFKIGSELRHYYNESLDRLKVLKSKFHEEIEDKNR